MDKEKFILIGIIILGIILRLVNLNQSFWLDEASQAQMSSMTVRNIWFDRQADFHPPLFYIISHYWLVLGTNEVWLRLLPAIFGVVAIPIIFLLARELGGEKLGLMSAFILSINPYHIYYSQEFRSYSLLALLGILSMYFYYKKSKWLGVINTLCLYTHYSGIFILIAQGFHSLILDRKKLKSFIASLILTMVLVIPWVPQFLTQLKAGVNIDAFLPGWRSVLTISPLKAVPLILFKLVAGRIDIIPKYIYAVYIMFVLTVTFLAIILSRGKRRLLYSWVFIPLIASILLSFFIPQTQPFRLIFILPGLLILLAESCLRFPKVFIALIVYISIVGNFMYFTRPRFQREQWREASKFLQQTKTTVVVKFSGPFAPMTWYAKDLDIIAAVPKFPAQPIDVSQILSLKLSGKQDIYLLEYLTGLTDPNNTVNTVIENLGFVKTDTKNFEGVGLIYHYVK